MDALLTQYDFRQQRLWVWIGMAISVAWIIGLNVLVLFSMELFNRMLLHPPSFLACWLYGHEFALPQPGF